MTTLTPGKWSSEFVLSSSIVAGFVLLVLFDKIVLTQTMMQDVFNLAMAYIAGRALPKTAEQIGKLGTRAAAAEVLKELKK